MIGLFATRTEAGVLELEIRRPERRNALDPALTGALAEALGDVDHGVDCVLLTGQGASFCAGYDLRAVDVGDPHRVARTADAVIAPLRSPLLDALDACPVPTVAAIQGEALGGGLELALACDLRVAADDARFGFPAARLGLVYSHDGIARAVNVLGAARAKQLFLLGDPIDAHTALGWGMVAQVVERDALLAEGRRLARSVASRSRVAQRGNRRILHLVETTAGVLSPDQRREAERLRGEALACGDLHEGIRAFRERRQPAWPQRAVCVAR